MISNLKKLKLKSNQLYFQYKDGSITLEGYLKQIKPLDDKIDSLELHVLSCYLQDIPVFEKSFLKHLY